MGHFDRYWEMSEGGPYDEPSQIFKCKDCGAETCTEKGWNGEPDAHQCSAACPSRASDWRPGRVSDLFRRNLDRVNFSDEFHYANKKKDRSAAAAAQSNYAAHYDAIFAQGVADAH
jgi:hypothetical protein